jgi:hypothetical protein
LAHERTPSRPRSATGSLPLDNNIVLTSGPGSELRADCPGYVDPLAAALKPAVPSDSLRL